MRLILLLATSLLLAVVVFPAAAQSGASSKGEGRIAREVRHELVTLPYYSVFENLAYKVDGYTVTLVGQVTRPTLKSDAEKAVKRIEGVGNVVNKIEVLPLLVHRTIRSAAGGLTCDIQPTRLGSVQPARRNCRQRSPGRFFRHQRSVSKSLTGLRANRGRFRYPSTGAMARKRSTIAPCRCGVVASLASSATSKTQSFILMNSAAGCAGSKPFGDRLSVSPFNSPANLRDFLSDRSQLSSLCVSAMWLRTARVTSRSGCQCRRKLRSPRARR